MSFCCEQCGYENNEIQSGAAVQDKGIRFTLNVKADRDLNRQVVKSDYTSVKILELDFEIPAKSQKGGLNFSRLIITLFNQRCIYFILSFNNPIYYLFIVEVTTVEGIINRVITGLEQDQTERKLDHPEVAAQIDKFVEQLKTLKDLKKPFTIVC